MLLVHVHDDVLHAVVVPLVGGGDGLNDFVHHKGLGDVALLFQQLQRGKNLRGVHAGGFFLLLASHGSILLTLVKYVFFDRNIDA